MPSLPDGIVIFVLALLLFGPKKLPVLARELGKWVGEFRRASNEFKMQMEEELRISEQADKQKEIAAMEAAAPLQPLHTPGQDVESYVDPYPEPNADGIPAPSEPRPGVPTEEPEHPHLDRYEASYEAEAKAEPAPRPDPLPIATSGELKIMPPATGLPTPRSASNDIAPLFDSIPLADSAHPEPVPTESVAHG